MVLRWHVVGRTMKRCSDNRMQGEEGGWYGKYSQQITNITVFLGRVVRVFLCVHPLGHETLVDPSEIIPLLKPWAWTQEKNSYKRHKMWNLWTLDFRLNQHCNMKGLWRSQEMHPAWHAWFSPHFKAKEEMPSIFSKPSEFK